MGEIVMNIYYEFKLRQVFHEAADNREDVIPDAQTWNYLIALMLRKRLASLKDTEILERYRPSFPLDFDTFIKTITQAFGDRSLKRLEINIDDSKEQLENCRTLINMMNIKFLSKDELYQLANIIYQSNKKSQEAEKALGKIMKDIHGYSEDVFGFVWDKIYGDSDYTQIKLPHTYIKQEKAALEKEFNMRRVRNVHYRKQAIKVLKVYETGIIKEIAYCADKDFAVENYKIPKEFPYFEELTQFFNQIGATKELLFSKYLPSYLGFDDLSDDQYNQYFFEIKKGRKLKQLLNDTGHTLMGYEPLFKYWAKELLYAFRDLTYRSTYNLADDITLKNVFVSDVGIKLYLKKIKFGEQRDDTIDYHLQIESQLLKMYAKLLVEMLTNREDYQEFDNLEIDPELKCILYECYHAKDKTEVREHLRYENEINRFIQKEQEKSMKQEKLNKDREEFQIEANNHRSMKLKEEEENLKLQEIELRKRSPSKENHKSADAAKLGKEIPQRSIKRKPDIPQSNKRNFEEENIRMGVRNELDLLMGESPDKVRFAQTKKDKGLIEYSVSNQQNLPQANTKGFEESKQNTMSSGLKKQKQERYLTIQALLNHPYFIAINEADVAVIIDEFEKLMLPE